LAENAPLAVKGFMACGGGPKGLDKVSAPGPPKHRKKKNFFKIFPTQFRDMKFQGYTQHLGINKLLTHHEHSFQYQKNLHPANYATIKN